MADDVKRINGAQYDQGSCVLKIRNRPIYGWVAVQWSEKRERTKGGSTGKARVPLGRSRGKYSTDPVKITVRRDTASRIEDMLAEVASDGQSYGNVEDSLIVLQYIEDESNQLPVTIEFVDCALITSPGNNSEDGLDMADLEFDCMKIDKTIDGKKRTLYDATEGG